MAKSKVDINNMSKGERAKLSQVLEKQYNPDGSIKDISWMYSKNEVDHESYLLGKKIQDIQEVNLRDDYNRGATAAPLDVDSTLLERRGKMDLEAKLKEDPMELIKAKEIEQKRKLLENTVKLKKLEKMVKSRTEAVDTPKQKKKKHRRRSSSSSSSSSSSASSGDELLSQFLAIVGKKNAKPTDDNSQNDKSTKRSNISDDEPEKRSRYKGRDRSRSPQIRADNYRTKDRSPRRANTSSHYDRRHLSSTKSYDRRERRHSRSPVPVRKDFSRDKRRSKSPIQKKYPSHERGKINERLPSSKTNDNETKKKRSAEDMARLREEMQMNAKSRDKERIERVDSYRKERDREDTEIESGANKGAGFLRPMVMKHAANATVEENVKRRIHTNQRSDTDNSFLRK